MMAPSQPPESTDNHRPEIESTSFVKRGRLWTPETAQRRSPFQKFWHWTGFKEKKLWDVLQLLMPLLVVLVGTVSFQWMMKERDLQIADNHAKQEILINYFDQISTLLFEQKLRIYKEGNEARIVARARTLLALRDLDGQRKGQLIRFLSEANLIKRNRPSSSIVTDKLSADILRLPPIIDLSSADLSEAVLPQAALIDADLSRINLRGANMQRASLIGADLRADLIGANLSNADLENANLVGVELNGVALTGAYMVGTNLYAADLSGAILKQSFTPTFEKALFCNTILPDGTKSDRDCDKLQQPE